MKSRGKFIFVVLTIGVAVIIIMLLGCSKQAEWCDQDKAVDESEPTIQEVVEETVAEVAE